METNNSGGPAFPVPESSRQQGNGEILHDCEKGMSLRDYFAAKAMQACISAIPAHNAYDVDNLARFSYIQADAMIHARGGE